MVILVSENSFDCYWAIHICHLSSNKTPRYLMELAAAIALLPIFTEKLPVGLFSIGLFEISIYFVLLKLSESLLLRNHKFIFSSSSFVFKFKELMFLSEQIRKVSSVYKLTLHSGGDFAGLVYRAS